MILLSVSGVLYAGAGYGYNYKMKDGELSHPHAHHWRVAKDQGPGLVMDGIFYTRCQLSQVGFLKFLAPSEEDLRRFDEDRSQLLAGDGETSAAGRTSSKKDKKKDKKKEKDRDKRRKSDHKSSKSSKSDRRESKKKGVVEPPPDSPVREIKDVARVEERVMDIEIAEGTIKE